MAAVIRSGSVLTIILNGRSYTVGPSHINYKAIRENLTNDNVLATLVDVAKSITQYSGRLVNIVDGVVTYAGNELHNVITDRIIEMMREQLPIDGMCLFLENLLQNPSKHAVEQLYTFLEHKHLPIDETGCFLSYKAIQKDWYSKTAGDIVLLQGKVKDGKIYNHPGETIECVRNNVCDNKDIACSTGLHVGALEYVQGFGSGDDRYVICRVNPRDVVSVPSDSSCQKVRACKYEVLCEYQGPLNFPCYEVTKTNEPDYDYQPEQASQDSDFVRALEQQERCVGEPHQILSVKTIKSPVVRQTVKYGLKPSGQRFYDVRDGGGRFSKKT